MVVVLVSESLLARVTPTAVAVVALESDPALPVSFYFFVDL